MPKVTTQISAVHLTRTQWLLLGIFLVGVLIRILYVHATPYSVREHDVWSHIDYIRFVAEHWVLPDPHASSQFYHPPLYYFLTAGIYALMTINNASHEQALVIVEYVSLALSILTFAVILWTGWMIFHREQQRLALGLFGLLAAVLPGIVFFASRINNDALAQLFVFGSFAVFLHWWRHPRLSVWMGLSIIMGVGVLAKGTVLLLPVIVCACLLFHHTLSLRRKFIQIALLGLFILAIAGWFHIPRALTEHAGRAALVGNVGVLTNTVENTPSYLLTVNPVQIIRHPFNNPFDDAYRRQYFWEYLLRSGFFGEFDFGTPYIVLAQLILAATMLSFVPIAIHLWHDIRRGDPAHLPLRLTLLILLLTHFLYRIFFAFSSSQDFRYSILLIVPLGAYALLGMEHDRSWLRTVTIAATGTVIVACSAFLLSLSLQTF